MPAHSENSDPPKKDKWTNDPPMFWVTLAGVVVVGLYTAVAAWQASLTRGQLAIMQQQLNDSEILEAASLTIRNFRIDGFPANTVVSYEISNDGRTRADEITCPGTIRNQIKPEDESAAFSGAMNGLTPNPSGSSMSPNEAPRRFRGDPTSFPASPDESTYFLALCAYRDVFRKLHRVTECLVNHAGSVGFRQCPIQGSRRD